MVEIKVKCEKFLFHVFVSNYRRTRKSARKTERKKWSLKEGSAYEEFALVEALSKLIQQVEDTKSKNISLE